MYFALHQKLCFSQFKCNGQNTRNLVTYCDYQLTEFARKKQIFENIRCVFPPLFTWRQVIRVLKVKE